jgi:phytanoyl-CoA hydroxylase
VDTPTAAPTATKPNSAVNTVTDFDAKAGVFFDGEAGAYADALYNPGSVARTTPTLDAITDADFSFFADQGYLTVQQAFTPAEVKTAIQGLVNLAAGRRPDFKEIVFEAKAREMFDRVSLEDRLDYVRKLNEFVEFDSGLKAIGYHPKLLQAVRRIIGEDIVMYSNFALLKPPRLGREKPWHQDNAYFGFPLDTKVVGVWIALDEATVENGCMQLLPELRKQGANLHFKRRDWQICDNEVLGRRSVAAPLKPGGLLFFDGMLPHGTPENRTATRRRAIQFHFVPARARKGSEEDRLKVFGSEGKNVTC